MHLRRLSRVSLTVPVLLVLGCIQATAQSLVHVNVYPHQVTGGVTIQGMVTLDHDAPHEGTVVSLASNETAVTVPASVTVPAGHHSVLFHVVTSAVTVHVTATITAQLGHDTKTTDLLVLAPLLDAISVHPETVTGGQALLGFIRLTGIAPHGGYEIAISSNSEHAIVPTTVTVPEGHMHAAFHIHTLAVHSQITVTITGTAHDVSKSAHLTIQ